MGYTTNQVEVATSLKRQGVRNLPKHAGPAPYRWDSQADKFALAGHDVGQTPSQIAASLSANGYIASTAEVALSLNKQGMQNGSL